MKKNFCFDREWELSGLIKLLKLMKLTVFLILISVAGVFANKSYSQSKMLNLNMRGATVKEVLKNIEEQSKFYFLYSEDLIDIERNVNVNIENKNIQEVLTLIFDGTDVDYSIRDRIIVLSTPEMLKNELDALQQKSVRGNVSDVGGEPLPGVTVVVKGTTNGTITDFEGNYTIADIPDGAVLQFSFVGMKSQEIVVGNQAVVNITLEEETIGLEEVVAIGYGIQKKSDVVGSISSVNSDDLENRTVTNVNQALQGKAAGVQMISASASPGAESSIRIRGYSSNASSDPLYVVDGVRVSSINNIDPNDIESMEILKDAASAAIYGAEAGNGVVLITTKKGELGDGKISYNFKYVIQSLAKKAEVMNANQYLDYMVKSNAFDQSKADKWDGTDTNWSDVLFEASPMQQHGVSFQKGSGKGSLYASFNYLDNDGIVRGDKDTYRRITGNVNVDYDIKDWLNFTSSNLITYTTRSKVAENDEYTSVLRAALSLDPLTPNIYPADNLPSWMQSLVDANYKLVQDSNGDYYSISDYLAGADDINPNILIYSGYTKNREQYIQGNTALNIKPIEGLTITSRLGYRLGANNIYSYQSGYYATATKNQDKASVESTVRSTQYYQVENFANYIKSIDNHNFVLMAGSSYSSMRDNYATTGGLGLQFDSDRYAYPDYLSPSATELITDGDDLVTKKLSYFGRLTYDFDNKYMLQASMRADAADLSILPESQRWGYFPAVSVGWRISRENWFLQNDDLISNMKLRASWGQNGSIAGLRNFAYAKVIVNSGAYSFDANNPSYTAGSVPSATGNDNLKWETSEQMNIGLDMYMLKSKLTFSADYYVKKTKDLIVSGTNPTLTIGNTVSPVNAGNVENKGFEFSLGWRDEIGKFKYNIAANLATLKNEVTYLDPTIDRIAGFEYNRATVTAFEKGYPIWYFRGYQVDHIDQTTGNPLYVKADGSLTDIPSPDDMTMIGSGIPDITYGLTLNLSYKNFNMVVFGQGSKGNEVFSGLTKTDRPQTNRLAVYQTDAWTSTNTNAKYARMDYQEAYYWQSSAVVFDGSYFKIKQIQFGYNVPDRLLQKMKLSSLRVYTSLDDFFLFTKYPGLDPEASSGTTQALGVDIGSYPSPKSVVFGLNLSF